MVSCHLPPPTRSPEEALSSWKDRRWPGTRSCLTSEAFGFLEKLGSDRITVCENICDPLIPNLRWNIYQDNRYPEIFVVIGKFGVKEFGNVRYEESLSERLSLQRSGNEKFTQFAEIITDMKRKFLEIP